MSDEINNNLAAKIAQLIQAESRATDFQSLQKSIEKISERLEKIEATLQNQPVSNAQSPSLSFSRMVHPSQEKFDVMEIPSDEGNKNYDFEKHCPYEPTGKPCDHCSMCNSRGF